MDDTERHVASFLASVGYQTHNIVYEPDGNIPPDFLLGGKIAVEARRLNQNYEHGSRIEGLEEATIPLFQKIKKICESFGPPTGENSWFVSYDFSRPATKWAILKPKIREFLYNFYRCPNTSRKKTKIDNCLYIEIAASNLRFETFFVIGMHIDEQAGGWLIPQMIRNIKICLEEKGDKIATYKSKYPQWWLVLVDRIGYGAIDPDDIEFIRREVTALRDWDQVIVLDAGDYTRSFRLLGE